MLIEKLQAINQRFEEVGELITNPEIISDMKRYIQLNKEYKDLEPIIQAYKEYKNTLDNIGSAREILNNEKDPEFREMAKAELDDLLERQEALEEEIRILLIPADPQDSKTPSWRSVPEPEVTRPLFLPATSTACM
jgi:peptide chain release factor 1